MRSISFPANSYPTANSSHSAISLLLLPNMPKPKAGTRRQTHRQRIHCQPVIEQIVQFAELLFLGHLLEIPNSKTPLSGSKTRIVIVIASRWILFMQRQSCYRTAPRMMYRPQASFRTAPCVNHERRITVSNAGRQTQRGWRHLKCIEERYSLSRFARKGTLARSEC